MAELRFTLTGQMPSGKNSIKETFVNGIKIRYPNARFKIWRAKSFQQLLAQRRGWPTLRTEARIEVAYTRGDNLRRDAPGMMDALCHLLEYCPVCRKKNKACNIPFVQDDALLADWSWKKLPIDRARPRIEVTITPLEPELPHQGDQK